MQNLLTGKLKPNGTWRKEDEFYKDDKFGKVPIGWIVKPVGDKSVCQLNPNYKFIKGEEYPFLPMEAIYDKFNGINYFERRKVDTSSGYARFKNGDILFAKITPCTENGKVAFVDNLNSDIGFASTEFIVLSPNENVNPKYLYYRVINGDVHRLAVSLMEGTTGRQRVPAKVFRNRIFIVIPSDKEEQRIIAEKIGSVDNHFLSKQTKIKKLERLKKALMQNLLTGKVRVKVPKVEFQTEKW